MSRKSTHVSPETHASSRFAGNQRVRQVLSGHPCGYMERLHDGAQQAAPAALSKVKEGGADGTQSMMSDRYCRLADAVCRPSVT